MKTLGEAVRTDMFDFEVTMNKALNRVNRKGVTQEGALNRWD